MIGVPKHSRFFTTLPLPCNILNAHRRTKYREGLGTRQSFDIVAKVAKVQDFPGYSPTTPPPPPETLYIEILTNNDNDGKLDTCSS